MSDFLSGFLRSEQSDQDVIKLKRLYIDLFDSLIDAVLFSQIVYWHTPDKYGNRRQRVFKGDKWWIAKRYEDWDDECRINANTARDSIKRMVVMGIVEKKIYHFNGKPCVHLRIVPEIFKKMTLELLQPDDENPKLRETPYEGNRSLHPTAAVGYYTETTTETTKDLADATKSPDEKPAVETVDYETLSDKRKVQQHIHHLLYNAPLNLKLSPNQASFANKFKTEFTAQFPARDLTLAALKYATKAYLRDKKAGWNFSRNPVNFWSDLRPHLEKYWTKAEQPIKGEVVDVENSPPPPVPKPRGGTQ